MVVAAFLVVLPGVLLVNAAFPPGRLSRLERGYLSVAGGVLLLILVGVVLGLFPHGDRGFFQTAATGLPNVEIATLAVSLVLFHLGLQRGAYPNIARRFPRLTAPDARFFSARRTRGPP